MSNHYRHFKHLHIPDGWEQYWSKYPNGYTLMEALINWVGQVNDMVEVSNEVSDQITCLQRNFNALDKELRASWAGYKESTTKQYEDFRDEVNTIINNWIANIEPTIQNKVVQSLQLWLSDGTLADIINNDVFDMKANQSDLVALTEKVSLNTHSANVKSYGAKGDGVTDDSIAIQQALNENTSIFIPEGEYIIKTPLTFTGQKRIYGETPNTTILKKVGNGKLETTETFDHRGNPTVVYADYDALLIVKDYSGDFSIENLTFISDEAMSDYGILIPHSYRVNLFNLVLNGFKENIRFFSTWNTNLKKIRSRFAGEYAFRIEGLNDSMPQSTSVHFDNTFAEYCKVGFRLLNVTYFSGSAMSCDFATEVSYWFEYSQGGINGLGVEGSEGQFIRSWMSTMFISGMYTTGNKNTTGIRPRGKTHAKIEVWASNRYNTGLTISGGDLRQLVGTGDASYYSVSGNSQLILQNVFDSYMTGSVTREPEVENNSVAIIQNATLWNLQPRIVNLQGKDRLMVGNYNMTKDLYGYYRDDHLSTPDGYTYYRRSNVSSTELTLPLSEIRKRFPSFALNDAYIAEFYKISIASGTNQFCYDYVLSRKSFVSTHAKTISGSIELLSIALTSDNIVLTLNGSYNQIRVHIQAI